jgi:hypothetical protein
MDMPAKKRGRPPKLSCAPELAIVADNAINHIVDFVIEAENEIEKDVETMGICQIALKLPRHQREDIKQLREEKSKNRCTLEAIKYTSRTDFCNGSGGAYETARMKGWLDEICSHMKHNNRHVVNGFWQKKENCHNEALKYTTRVEFHNKNGSAYEISREKGWLDDICGHMEASHNKVNKGFWKDKEKCREEAMKFPSRKVFSRTAAGAYTSAKKNGWLDEICAHMTEGREGVVHQQWNSKENCHIEALKYNSRNQFMKGCRGAYNGASRNGFLEEICSHMRPAPLFTVTDGAEPDNEQDVPMNVEVQTIEVLPPSEPPKKRRRKDQVCSHIYFVYICV